MIRRASLVDDCIIAAPPGFTSDEFRCVPGGSTRQESAANALALVGDTEAVVVHDAARALASSALFDAVLSALDECEAVVPAVPVRDTIKRIAADVVSETLDRAELVAIQTPQAFRTDLYRRAHARAAEDAFIGTDDAALVERLGVKVRVVEGEESNIKITTMQDVRIAETLL